MAERTPNDFQDDLNFVVTAAEAALWYGIPYDELKQMVLDGEVAGRMSASMLLVSVDAMRALYGDPELPRGRRKRVRAGNGVKP